MRARILLLVLGSAGPAAAQPAMPKFSYQRPTPDGRFVLVMLGTGDLPPTVVASARERDAALRAAYPRSGLYPAGQTAAPVWVPDEYWEEATTVFADNTHAVRIHRGYEVVLKAVEMDGYPTDGRLPPDAERADLDSPAITFYARGRPLKTYTVRELVSDPAAVPHGPNRVLWCGGSGRTDELLRYTVHTTDGNVVVFDATTGEVIGRSKTKEWLVRRAQAAVPAVIGIVAAVAVVIGGGWWWVRRRRMREPAAAVTQPEG